MITDVSTSTDSNQTLEDDTFDTVNIPNIVDTTDIPDTVDANTQETEDIPYTANVNDDTQPEV